MEQGRNVRLTMNRMAAIQRGRNRFIQERLRRYGLSGPMYRFLISLDSYPGCSQDYLVEHYDMDKGNVARIAKKMESMGFIRREVSEEDHRQYKLYLTPKGQALKPEVVAAIDDWGGIVCAGMSEEERNLALSLVTRMAENIAREKS